MARFTLTKTTPVLLGMLALTACPSDDVPQDTEGTSTGDTTTMTPTTTPMNTTVDPDSTSGEESSTTAPDPCAGVECEPGEQCVGGLCFDCGVPTCVGGCPGGEVCQCPADDVCCDVGECGAPICPLPTLPGNYAACLDAEGQTSDEPCDGAGCVVDSDSNPSAGVCVAQGCQANCQCPAAPAGSAAQPTCEDVTGDNVNDCWLDCGSGSACPDGMFCFAGFICLFSINELVDLPLYGDCANTPGAVCTDGFCVAAPTGAVCTASCGNVADCEPVPPTGNAPAQCTDVTGDNVPECTLSCSGGQTCPDGMDCFGGFVCIWPTMAPPPPPPPPASGYGDCVDNPESTCQPGEETCLTSMDGTAGACSLGGCVDAAADCPLAPPTGTAPVTCGDLGGGNTCYLDCSAGEVCPDGMTCTVMGAGGSACLWPDDGFLLDESFEQGFLRPGWSLINGDGLAPAAQVSFINDAFVVSDALEAGMNFGAYSTSYYIPAGTANDWLITPQVTLGAASVLGWRGRAPDAAYADGYEVRISTGMPIEADFMANPPLFTIADETPMFTLRSVDLAAAGYMNQAVYIAFRNNSTDDFILIIDDIQITE
jgi:hypothetical protein